jgi:aryl-alcohol dehydrogenase-like predicted oxidoreductase
MRTLPLPGTDLTCSAIGLGTWGLFGPNDIGNISLGWPVIEERVSRRIIDTAIELGINLFDCSDFYGLGRAESLLGNALGGLRKNVVVATKVGLLPRLRSGTSDLDRTFSATHIQRSTENSLRRLRRDTIDLYQLHGPGAEVLQQDETWRALDRLKASGMIRYIGVSLGSSQSRISALDRWLKVPSLSVVQIEYSLAGPLRASELDGIDAQGKAIVARSVFAHGLLLRDPHENIQFEAVDHRRRKWSKHWAARLRPFATALRDLDHSRSLLETALGYALDSRLASVALVGATSPDQVRALVAACDAPELRKEERAHIQQLASAAFS